MDAMDGPALRLTLWASDSPLASSRSEPARAALIRPDFLLLENMSVVLALVRFIDEELTRIDEHHHQHAAGENVVGGDLALVMRVPHEGEARLGSRRIGDRAGRRRRARGAD